MRWCRWPDARRERRRHKAAMERQAWNRRRRSVPTRTPLLHRRAAPEANVARSTRRLRACVLRLEQRLERSVLVLLGGEFVRVRRKWRVDRLARAVGIVRVEMIAMGPRLAVYVRSHIPGVFGGKIRFIVMCPEGHV